MSANEEYMVQRLSEAFQQAQIDAVDFFVNTLVNSLEKIKDDGRTWDAEGFINVLNGSREAYVSEIHRRP